MSCTPPTVTVYVPLASVPAEKAAVRPAVQAAVEPLPSATSF